MKVECEGWQDGMEDSRFTIYYAAYRIDITIILLQHGDMGSKT